MTEPQVRSEPTPPFPKLKRARPVWTPLDLADTGHPPVQGDAPPPCSFGGFGVSRGVYDDAYARFNRRGAFALIVRRGLRNERQPDDDDYESDDRGRGRGNSRGATDSSRPASRVRRAVFVAIDALDTVDARSGLCASARWRSSGDRRSRPVQSINAIQRHVDFLDGDRHE